MPTREWIFTINTLESNTRGTQKKALSLVNDTDAKLQNEIADPDIAVTYNQLHPFVLSYNQMWQNYQVAEGTYEGKTLDVESQLEDITVDLKIWEGKIRSEFPEDSPTEREIFPNKRAPFQTGTYETRINSLGALATKLLDYTGLPVIAATQLLVQSRFNQLESSRILQQNKEGALGQLSDLLENQRILVMDEMYGVLGRLMFKFRSDRKQITRFFDLSLLRNTGNDDEPLTAKGDVPANAVKDFVDIGEDIEPTADLRIKLKNITTSPVSLRFFFTDDAGLDGSEGITLLSGQEIETTLGALGFNPARRRFRVTNQSETDGVYTVEVL